MSASSQALRGITVLCEYKRNKRILGRAHKQISEVCQKIE